MCHFPLLVLEGTSHCWTYYISFRGLKQEEMEAYPLERLGPPVVPFLPFFGEGSPTKLDYRRKGTLILTVVLEDLAQSCFCPMTCPVKTKR